MRLGVALLVSMIQVLLSAILLPRTLEAALGAPFSDDYNTLDALDDLRPPPVIPIPTRPLQWGEANFLSTSDTHGELCKVLELTSGWLLGHQHVRPLLSSVELTMEEHLARTGKSCSSSRRKLARIAQRPATPAVR